MVTPPGPDFGIGVQESEFSNFFSGNLESPSVREVNIKPHEKLKMFFHPIPGIRYKAVKGGRGGGKSYGCRDAALVRMLNGKEIITVCREYKSTIGDSVHRLLKGGIERYGLGAYFHVTDNSITCKLTGSLLTYKHLHDNVTEAKGLEGTTILWIFEAEDLSEGSFSIVDPTIRAVSDAGNDPEIWVEWNPKYEDDFVWKFFVVNQPENCLLEHINYDENPHCPENLIELADRCRRTNPEQYEHVWLGQPKNKGGLVYPMFRKDIHVRDFDLDALVRSNANFFMGQDPHTSYYPFCVWLARVPKGDDEFDYVIYNEWPTVGTFGGKLYHEVRHQRMCSLSLRQRAAMYRVLDNTLDRTYHGVWMLARGIDTRFAKSSGGVSTTLKTRGIIIEMSDPENGAMNFETPPEGVIDVQRDRIRSLLEFDTFLPVHTLNDAHLFVMPHCHNVIDAFRFHRYEEIRSVGVDGGQREKESETRKDPIDAVRIAMATASQYEHRSREVHEFRGQQSVEAVSSVDVLSGMFLNRRK